MVLPKKKDGSENAANKMPSEEALANDSPVRAGVNHQEELVQLDGFVTPMKLSDNFSSKSASEAYQKMYQHGKLLISAQEEMEPSDDDKM